MLLRKDIVALIGLVALSKDSSIGVPVVMVMISSETEETPLEVEESALKVDGTASKAEKMEKKAEEMVSEAEKMGSEMRERELERS